MFEKRAPGRRPGGPFLFYEIACIFAETCYKMATPNKRRKTPPKRKTKPAVYDPSKARLPSKKQSKKFTKTGRKKTYRIPMLPPDDTDQYVVKPIVPYQVGRPTPYDPSFCMHLIKHLASGLSFEAFAGCVSVSKSTLYAWVEAHEEFSDAKTIGQEMCRVYWEQVSRANGTKNVGNFQGIRFNMLNRFRDDWHDANHIDVTTRGKEVRQSINLSALDTATLRKLIEGEDNAE